MGSSLSLVVVVVMVWGRVMGRMVYTRRIQEVIRAMVLLGGVVCRGEDILGATDEVRC